MNRNLLCFISIALAFVGSYCCLAIQTESGPALGIEIDLTEPALIVWPCEIDYVGDNGEKGLRIPPKVGRGWLEEAGGSATYKFFIPDDDEYYLWIYCKWFDECTNAVYSQIDDQDKTTIGNDPVYDQWHWVRGSPAQLNKGTHTVVLSNHSDNVKFQKVVLMNSKSSGPDSSQITFSDLFYDGFDGCDEGNFSNWNVVAGSFQVMDPKSQSCQAQNALKGISTDKAMIVLADENWQNYSLDLEVKTEVFEPGKSKLGVCFALNDAGRYYMLSFTCKDDASMVTVALTEHSEDKVKTIDSFDFSCQLQKWTRLQIRPDNSSVEFTFGEQKFKTSATKIIMHGGIGLYLQGNTIAYFDNIHVRKIEQKSENYDRNQ